MFGAFEVSVNGALVHSKMKSMNGGGYVDNEGKWEGIIAAIKSAR